MPQNGPHSGPPWSSGGGSDEPYTEPADPWGEQADAASGPTWGARQPVIPQQHGPLHADLVSDDGPKWGQPAHPPPPLPPAKRNTPMVALVVTLAVLICAGLGVTLWILNGRKVKTPAAVSATSAAPEPGPGRFGSEDARFVKKGDCVVNEGTDDKPEMRAIVCTSGTYVVLARIDGRTSGKQDAEGKCAKVQGYTKWYFYDSQLDDLDFVLCLKEHKSL